MSARAILALALQGLVFAVPMAAAQSAGPVMSSGNQAELRWLDKVSGETHDVTLAVGASTSYGHLSVSLTACRYPADNPTSDAVAFLEIGDNRSGERLFRGWMMAAAPALNALDHPRYDVWVLGCRG